MTKLGLLLIKRAISETRERVNPINTLHKSKYSTQTTV